MIVDAVTPSPLAWKDETTLLVWESYQLDVGSWAAEEIGPGALPRHGYHPPRAIGLWPVVEPSVVSPRGTKMAWLASDGVVCVADLPFDPNRSRTCARSLPDLRPERRERARRLHEKLETMTEFFTILQDGPDSASESCVRWVVNGSWPDRSVSFEQAGAAGSHTTTYQMRLSDDYHVVLENRNLRRRGGEPCLVEFLVTDVTEDYVEFERLEVGRWYWNVESCLGENRNNDGAVRFPLLCH